MLRGHMRAERRTRPLLHPLISHALYSDHVQTARNVCNNDVFNLLATDFFFQILAHLYLKCE